MVLEAG